MKDIKRLLNIIIFISCLFLVTSYFLPVEASWSPQQAWRGYYDPGGEFVAGFNVGLIEVFPYAVGIMISLAMVLLRWPKICIVKLAIFSTIWIISLGYEVNHILSNPSSYKLPNLWLILTALLVPSVVIVVILSLRKSRKKTAVLTFAAILTVSSILYQACSIAWYLLEDSLLLNIGAVIGVSAASVLLVALMTQRQISISMKEQT